MSETKDELEGQLSEAANRMSVWRSFISHPGWEMLREIVRANMEQRKVVVMSCPLQPDSNVFAQEFLKGQFSGNQEVLLMPQEQYEAAKRDVSLLNVHLENYDEAEIAGRPPKSRVDTDDHFGW